MLSPTTIFKYKLALIKAAQAGGYLVPGTRAYRLVGTVKIAVLLLGVQARATLSEYQKRHGLPVTGELDAATRESLIPADFRAGVVKWARWGVANTSSIHYSQRRPIPHTDSLPMWTDCSGFATLCYQLAGAPDPNGFGYNGSGYTGTLINRGRTVSIADARAGDLVFWGVAPAHHVAIVVAPGGNPLLVSHGMEAGPLYVDHATETAIQSRMGHGTVTVKSYLA